MRLPRFDFPGARHHVMNRGARSEPVFLDDGARTLFIEVLSELPERFGVLVHGYALMPNHYHLMLESVRGDLPRAMRHLGGEFTRRLNQRHRWDGPLFRGRYHNRVVETDDYWRHLLVYLHLNPVRAGLGPKQSCWTSHRVYLGLEPRPAWLTTTELQDLFGSEALYREAYELSLRPGAPLPAGFDPERLWAPNSSGSVDMPGDAEPIFDLADAIADVVRVTGLAQADVLLSSRGRVANPAPWLCAWWLSRGCGIDHGRISKVMDTTHSGVTKRIRKFEDRRQKDPLLRDWAMKLETGRLREKGK